MYSKTNIAGSSLFLFAIFLLPYDSIPLFPFETVHRPLYFFPLFCYWLFVKSYFRLYNKLDFASLFIVIALLCQSFFSGYYFFNDLSGFYKFALTGTIFYIIFNSTYTFIRQYLTQNSTDDLLHFISKSLLLSSLVPIIVGYVQFASILGLLNRNFSEKLTSIFSYRVDVSRIQLVSGEPSMGFRYLLLVLIFVYLFDERKSILRSFVLFSCVILMFFSGSSYGYLTIMISILIYIFLFSGVNKKRLMQFSLLFTLVLGIFLTSYESMVSNYAANRISSIISLLKSANLDSIMLLASQDGSFFLRVFNPIIGFISLKYSYGMGIGGENYFLIYSKIIKEYFPFAIQYPTIQLVIFEQSMITAKSLYSKIAAEFGLAPFILFCYYFVRTYKLMIKKWKTADKSRYLSTGVLYVYTITIILNFDSYIYFNFILVGIILHSLVYKSNRGYVRTRF